MPRQAPYLQRRGDTLFFRIAVPCDLRPLVGGRELTKTLRTAEKRNAIPIALAFAATAKRLFNELRASMAGADDSKHKELIRRAKADLKVLQLKGQRDDDLTQQRLQHVDEMKRVRLETEAEIKALKLAMALVSASGGHHPTPAPKNAPEGRKTTSSPLFKTVVDGFLDSYPREKKAAMYKKLRPVLTMLLEVVGNKPITELKQADINGYFSLLHRLPPRWQDECRKRGITAKELGGLDHPETLGPKSFDDTYKACVRTFLRVAKKDWQDQGFPTTLTTDGIEYQGDREEGERRQRAFSQAELERLFCGPEMQRFAADEDLAHCFWLPHVALFTGARVNELCQLNPQTDILLDAETGIQYFWITDDTEGDGRIRKSTKNAVSRRKVPIHSRLIALGFLSYVAQMRKEEAKLLFPAWKPSRGKASAGAEKWFRQLLRDTGLRDETAGERVVGMHAFRHTLLNRATNANPPIDATAITGHAGDTDAVVRGYQGELSLANKRRILEAIPIHIGCQRGRQEGRSPGSSPPATTSGRTA